MCLFCIFFLKKMQPKFNLRRLYKQKFERKGEQYTLYHINPKNTVAILKVTHPPHHTLSYTLCIAFHLAIFTQK